MTNRDDCASQSTRERMLRKCLLFLCCAATALSAGSTCQHRDYNNGGTVCVCNATDCDTVEPIGSLPPRQYCLYTSSKDGDRFAQTKRNFGTKLKSKGILITVNSAKRYQNILGFGGAFTDSAAINIHDLSEGAQKKLLEAYFSPDGIEYNFGRVPMAGSDFSTRPYTYNDKEFDVALTNFNLSSEDIEHKIPLIQQAKDMSNRTLNLLGAAWTAPPWMKTNNDYIGFGFLKEEYFRVWSNYHLRFLEEYDKHGLNFWGISTGNEPLNGAIPFFSFNCMGWTPLSQKTWVAEHLGPTISRSRFNQTLLLALDDQRFLLPWWLSAMFGKNESSPYIAGVGVHWYWDNIVPAALLDKTHEAFPDKFILATEACFVPRFWEKTAVSLGSWSRGEQYAESIINDMNHWVTGWIDWNLALDPNGGPNWADNFADAAVIVNKTADEFYKQPMFYAMGHFSKFVPEGSVRIDVQSAEKNVKVTGFRTPQDCVVLVILNKKTGDVPIGISGAPRGYANFVVPGKSITTVIYKDKKPPMLKIFS